MCTRNDFAGGSIPGAQQLSCGKVLFHQSELSEPDFGQIVTFCQSGLRNTVASSALRRAGFDVRESSSSRRRGLSSERAGVVVRAPSSRYAHTIAGIIAPCLSPSQMRPVSSEPRAGTPA
ncbi:rhodanese-like domain-containing protein [Brachybacterium avium]|uniref:rhodanese-like domain-containing protein n=1 Tax=Brachybacterium avium TaxID=2017485 RepID=UPI0030845FBA